MLTFVSRLSVRLTDLNNDLNAKQATIKYVDCYKDAIQTNSDYTYGSGGLYRINVGTPESFTNYPSGKTILAVIPLNGNKPSDASFTGFYNPNSAWGVVADYNVTYRFYIRVLYID